MHKSKLAGFIIDGQTDDLQGATQFWSAALGMETRELPEDERDKYIELVDKTGQMHVEVQSVSHPGRLNVDIATDDIEAEVHRLERLGAKRVETVKTCVVMEAPTGQRFCVVPAERGGFFKTAKYVAVSGLCQCARPIAICCRRQYLAISWVAGSIQNVLV